MNITDISKLISLVLATSVAGERLITLIKTFVPSIVSPPGEIPDNSKIQKFRKISLMVLSYACCTLTAWLVGKLNPDNTPTNPDASWTLNFWFLGLLATGGSAFWTNLLGYVSAIKDVQKQAAANNKIKMDANQ